MLRKNRFLLGYGAGLGSFYRLNGGFSWHKLLNDHARQIPNFRLRENMKLGMYILAGLVALMPITATGQSFTFTCEYGEKTDKKFVATIDMSKNEVKVEGTTLKIVENTDEAIFASAMSDNVLIAMSLNKVSGILNVAFLTSEDSKVDTASPDYSPEPRF